MSMMTSHHNRRPAHHLDWDALQDRIVPNVLGLLAVLALLATAYIAAPPSPEGRSGAEQNVPLRANSLR